jgi:phosphoserine phosphatase RsbU/P
MGANTTLPRLSAHELEALLAVTRALAAPFDLRAMLEQVTAAACSLLKAERASVWLYDASADELQVEIAQDLPAVRQPAGIGLVGACARERVLINVPDCYADPRFNPEMDRQLGFRTRCILSLPLVDHEDQLVGVLQIVNRLGGSFGPADEGLAQALAAQCAVALSRTRMAAQLLAAALVRKELELASTVQRSTLPKAVPQVAGYDVHGVFLPAAQTGGDTYDLALTPQGLLVVLADATGHGIAPALSVTQMHAMLKMALRLDASLETAFAQVNDQLVETLPDGRFVTAFVGLLDPARHRLRFLSGGQGPILHYRAEHDDFAVHRATSFPMGAMPLRQARPAVELAFAPGDWLVLLSDGIYETAAPDGQLYGRQRVQDLVRRHRDQCALSLAQLLLADVDAFRARTPQEDDVTAVLLRRTP